MNMNATLERKLDRLQAIEPISIASVDFTFNNPERVLQEQGPIFDNVRRVESFTPHYAHQVETMLPDLVEGPTGIFLNVWKAHETRHSEIIARAQEGLGVQPEVHPEPEILPFTKFIGWAAAHSPSTHRIVEMIYNARAARHERLTSEGYKIWIGKLGSIGETNFAETGLRQIMTQEAPHLGWYRAAALETRSKLSSRELRLASLLEDLTYWPVGASQSQYRSDFGAMALALSKEDLGKMANPVQDIGNQLLGHSSKWTKNAVSNKIIRCIKEYKKLNPHVDIEGFA
jgi:hypothetical protein